MLKDVNNVTRTKNVKKFFHLCFRDDAWVYNYDVCFSIGSVWSSAARRL